MIIIAPNTKTGVNKVENNLKKYTPERILGDLKKRKVDVRLPRFDFICTIDCIPILRKVLLKIVPVILRLSTLHNDWKLTPLYDFYAH